MIRDFLHTQVDAFAHLHSDFQSPVEMDQL